MKRLNQVCCGASLALVLAVTVSAGCIILTVCLVELFDKLLQSNREVRPSYAESLAVTEQGRPIIVRNQWWPVGRTQTFDLKNQPIVPVPDKPGMNLAGLPAEPPRSGHWLRQLGTTRRGRRVAAGVGNNQSWYLVFSGNRGARYCFQGLKTDDGQTIGYIGRDGFQKTKPARESHFMTTGRATIQGGMSSVNKSAVLLIDDQRLLSVNFAQRTVTRLIDEPIISIDRLGRRLSGRGYRISRDDAMWAARTGARVDVLNLNSGTRRSFAVPEKLRDRSFEFFALKEGALYFTSKDASDSHSNTEERTRRGEIVWATAAGKVTQRKPVSLSISTHADRGLSRQAQTRCMIAAVPATLWSAGIGFGVYPWLFAQFEQGVTFSEVFRQSADDNWWVVVLVGILCGWLARLTYRHQRQRGEPNGWFWALFVVFFGLPGYVGYRLHRSWPHHEPVPLPEPTGFEVFAN